MVAELSGRVTVRIISNGDRVISNDDSELSVMVTVEVISNNDSKLSAMTTVSYPQW